MTMFVDTVHDDNRSKSSTILTPHFSYVIEHGPLCRRPPCDVKFRSTRLHLLERPVVNLSGLEITLHQNIIDVPDFPTMRFI